MMRLLPAWLLLLLTLQAGPLALAAETGRTNLPPKIFRDRVEPHWFARADGETNQFWYRVELPAGRREFLLVNAATGQRRPAFDHARLAQALRAKTEQPADPERLPMELLEFNPTSSTLTFSVAGNTWQLDLGSYALTRPSVEIAQERRLNSARTPRPSLSTGAETEITFVNRLAETVEIFWSDPDGKRIPYGSLPGGESRAQHTFAGHVWVVCSSNGNVLAVFEAEAGTSTAIVDGTGNTEPRRRDGPGRRRAAGTKSPDGNWEATLHDHNLFLRDIRTGQEHALTSDASATNTYTRESDRPGPDVYWSPDSSQLVAMRRQPGSDRRVYLVESSPADQLQPKLQSFAYLKPGDAVPVLKPHLFDVTAKMEIPVDDQLFANPWSISDLHWGADSTRFTFLFNQRGHQALRILAVDSSSGRVTPVVNEESKTFINYSGKFFAEYLDNSGEIIWMSERDGWNHLYLYDAKSGTVKNQITKGEWVVRRVDRVDQQRRQVWFQAGGIRPGQDPYHVHFCRINFDGSDLTILTEGNGTHTAQFSPDGRCFIDTWSRVDAPPVNELRRTDDGKPLCRLETGDAGEVSAHGWQFPEPFVAKGRDGVTDIYGVLWRPRNFDTTRKYPVIENIYAGPQDSFAPKSFHATYPQQTLADLGFVVVQLDGMGTANRSKKFHDVCWKDLADSGFPDRILWIKAAAATYPQLDLTRVGIYGTSAGGQNALRGLLDHGDFYRAGVADCGCHDNRMDKIWWNEQWLGWPVDESYVKSSNVMDAHKLRGKLLLMVGELDKNVDPASTMQVVNALVKADKDFELLTMPGAGHGVARTPYGARRLQEFFVRTLLETK